MKDFIKKFVGIGMDNEANRVGWVETTLKKIPAGLRILDAGAGERQYQKFCSHLKYVSQDFAQYNGRGDSSGLQTEKWNNEGLDIVSDITAIPQPDGSFDAVMCTEVLEHVPDPVLAIKELSRLIKSGGWLIITAPFCSATHFSPYHFCTGFNRYFYERHLPANGFKIMEMTPNGNFFDYVAQEILRAPEMAGRYAKKHMYPWDYAIAFLMLKILKRFSKHGQSSSEFLTYGYHVLAVKQ